MNVEQSERIKYMSDNIIECWARIKAKARTEGHISNIEKYAACITAGLNQMERFLNELGEKDS